MGAKGGHLQVTGCRMIEYMNRCMCEVKQRDGFGFVKAGTALQKKSAYDEI